MICCIRQSYDQNGNVTSLGDKSFTYNSQNQMIAMTASGTSFAMIYDGFGNRVAKTGNGVTTQYLVEDDKKTTGLPQVFDELTNGVVTRTYAYGLQRIDEDQLIEGAWTLSFYGYDEGGSVRNLTGASGVVTDRYEYDAFGNSFTVSGATPNNYLYRGEQHDPDLGLYYLRTRYYNPLSGRFTGVDPLTDQGQPRYEYAGADPVNGLDPMGTEDMIECALLGANHLGCPFQFPVMMVAIVPHPPQQRDKLGIGIEIPKPDAVTKNVLNVARDPGHTFVYLKDVSSTVVSILSFGPGMSIPDNKIMFQSGNMPGTGHYPLEGNASTWETFISDGQLKTGEQDINNVKASPPNYTEAFNCTSGALSIASKIGITLPNGVGPVIARKFGYTAFSGNEANPYTLNQQMTAAYGSGRVVSTSAFPAP